MRRHAAREFIERESIAVWCLPCFGFLFSILLTLSVCSLSVDEMEARSGLAMRQQSLISLLVLDRTLHEQASAAKHLAAFLSTTGGFSGPQFESIAREMRIKGVMGAFEWAPLVRDFERESYEKAELQGRQIREIDVGGSMRRAAKRPQYLPVTLVEPLRENEEAVGLDLASEPNRSAAALSAFASGKVAATGPLSLVQEPTQRGILLMAPVKHLRHEAREDSRTREGLVVIALRIEALVELASTNSAGGVSLTRIDDVTDGRTPLWQGPSTTGSQEAAFNITFGGRDWEVHTAHKSTNPWWISPNFLIPLLFGSSTSVIVFLYLRSSALRRQDLLKRGKVLTDLALELMEENSKQKV